MASPPSQPEVRDEAPVRFMDRFALRRLDLLLVLLVVVLVGIRVWARGQRAYEGLLGRPLRVGIVSWPGYAGGLVANQGLRPNKDSDFWKNQNLLVEFVLREDEAQLLREFKQGGEKGGLDVIWSTVDSLAQQFPDLAKDGLRPRALLQVDWSRGADAIVASADIERIEDLRGKKVAVSQAASQWLFEYSLDNSALSPEDKKRIRDTRRRTRGSQEARDLFVNRRVDAAVLWEPDVSEALKRRAGARILIDSNGADKLIADILVANEDFIRQHPDVVDAFIKGWLRDGTTKAISDPMLAVQVLLQSEEKFAVLGEETTRDLLGKTALATFDDNVEMFGLSGGDALFDHVFRQASRTWWKAGYIADEVNPEWARDARFLRELYRPPVTGCQEYMTSELPIAFPRGRSELDAEARQILDDEKLSLQLRTHAGVRFYVEGSAEDEDNPERARAMSQAREEAVILYLTERYSRPRSQFISANEGAYKRDNGEKGIPCIHLKLINPSRR